MKKIFISYANDAMAYSLKRIGRQARRLHIFDEVILYTPKDLPEYAKSSPLMASPRGAGYWYWKPVMIAETLKRFDEGDIVVYVDSGCSLRKSNEWEEYFEQMSKYDNICFQYADNIDSWAKFGSSSSQIKHWAKKSTLDFMEAYLNNPSIGEYNQIMGGVLFMKGKNNSLLNTWLSIMNDHPELVMDPKEEEKKNQNEGFVAHRHDQTILTPLAMQDPDTLVLPEHIEKYSKDSFVWASRIRAKNFSQYIGIQFKHYMRIWLGDERFEAIKKKLHL